MKDNSFVKGETHEKKFENIERVLKRFSRRLQKSVVCAVPPSVISNYTFELPEDGVILRCIFPCPGKVRGITLHYSLLNEDNKPTLDVVFTDGMRTDAVSVRAHNPQIEEISVNQGTLMALKINGQVENIWVSALFVPSINAAEKEAIAIEQLDAIAGKTADEE